MATMAVAQSAVALGKTFTYSKTVTADGALTKDPALPAAKIGSLTTRTNDTSGTLTMNSGHGITTGQVIDIYWDGGVAYKVTVGTVATNSVPISGASGDALPAAATAITAMVVHEEPFVVGAAELQALAVGCGGVPMVARFVDALDADVAAIVVNPGTEQYVWADGMMNGAASPFDDDVAAVYLTHGSSAGEKNPTVTAMID